MAPHRHCVVLTRLPSNSRGVFKTTFRAKPAIYRTNFEERRIEAMLLVVLGKTGDFGFAVNVNEGRSEGYLK